MTSPGARRSAASAHPAVLSRILDETREALERRKRNVPLRALQDATVDAQASSSERPRGRFDDAIARSGIGVIAEFKRRSPSAGPLGDAPDLIAIVGAYERGGASALSILTEGPNFDGSLEDVRVARAACALPILRKDFIIDPYQLHEARAAGADAVLLIVAALQEEELAELHALALALDLDALVEAHDRQELRSALRIGARLVAINNRDLRDFSVDVGRTSEMMREMPAGVTVVSESGIATAKQLRELERQGVAAVLVGEALMCSANPQREIETLLAGSSASATPARSGEPSSTPL